MITQICSLCHSRYPINIAVSFVCLQRQLEELEDDPTSLDELKAVLKLIRDLRLRSLDVELEIRDIQERYRLLRLHQFYVSPAESARVMGIMSSWKQLLDSARVKEKSLGSVKRKFTKTTQEEIRKFALVVENLTRRFFEEGPGTKVHDLDAGAAAITVSCVMVCLVCTVISFLSSVYQIVFARRTS